jgi:hypothetical protein
MKKSPVVRLAIGIIAAVAAWYVLRQGTYVSSEVEWVCYGGKCSTDDLRPFLIVGGVALAILACALFVPMLRLAGFGLVLATASLAAVTGWEAAFTDGQVEALSGAVGFWRVVAIVGGVLAALGLIVELRRPGPSWRLFGWQSVPAELGRFEGGTAMVAFTTRDGRGHEARVPVREELREGPVDVYYLVRNPSRVRVAFQKTPTTTDEDTSALLSTELTRLAALHAEGHLTDTEFEQAKRRVLGG